MSSSKAGSLLSIFPKHFLLRRLHSLTGIVPVGLFLLEHIFTNSFSLIGAESYNSKIETLQGLPFVVVIEVLFIFLPLMFHALYGVMIVIEGKNNVHQYGYESNWRYMMQRFTGVVALIFICVHVYSTRFTSYFTGKPMTYAWVQEIMQSPATMWVYILASIAVIFHFCNGIWSFLIVWGITITKAAQKLTLQACMAAFVGLSIVNTLVVLNFAYPAGQPRPMIVDAVLTFIKGYLFGTH